MHFLLYPVYELGYTTPHALATEMLMKQKNVFWEYSEILIVALVLALIIRSFFIQAYKIPSESMLNTLQVGDYLFVTRFDYDLKIPFTDISILQTGDPKHGEMVVFRYPLNPSLTYIKRVIGLPGDKIEIRNKQLFRNGKLIDEPYKRITAPWRQDDFGPITVPDGQYFMLGDNRDGSSDSREWGFVPRKNLQGKALILYWSWKGMGDIRWERIGTILRPSASITES